LVYVASAKTGATIRGPARNVDKLTEAGHVDDYTSIRLRIDVSDLAHFRVGPSCLRCREIPAFMVSVCCDQSGSQMERGIDTK
jgi:hypothetical protein